MNDKQIIPEIEKNYIDTLYLSCNLQDFCTDSSKHSTLGYWEQKEKLKEKYLVPGVEYSGLANGYSWFKLDNFSIGIMEYDQAIRTNQPNCVIQYRHHHIFDLDQQLTGLELPFGEDRSKYMIKRIDLTKTIKCKIDYTLDHGYISPFRADPLNPIRFENTVYLGSRKNGNVVRIYPKTKELMDKEDFDKIARYSKHFGTIENLYTFEHEMRRSFLKETLGIDNLSELDKVWTASHNIVSKIRIFEPTDQNRKLLRQRNHKRIEAMTLTPYEEYTRPQKKRYKRSYRAMVGRMRSTLDAYLSTEEGKEWESLPNYAALVYDLFEDRLDGKDLTIWVDDSERVVDIAKMRAKHELMRDGQTNELEMEARRLFG